MKVWCGHGGEAAEWYFRWIYMAMPNLKVHQGWQLFCQVQALSTEVVNFNFLVVTTISGEGCTESCRSRQRHCCWCFCTTKLPPMPMILGGPGVVVQIDESLFRHKPKVGCSRNQTLILATLFLQQNHRGRSTTTEVWVFGMVDTSQSPALGYMEVVSLRDAATLLPIIQAHTAPGTII